MKVDSPWTRVLATAAKQSGLATRQQVLAAGYSKNEWMQLLRNRALLPLDRGVCQVAQPEDPWLREAWATLLFAGPDAVLSHRSAARLHQLWALDRAAMPLELTLPRGRRLTAGEFSLHRSDVPDEDRTQVEGFPVTSVVRTVFDLARVLDFEALAMAFESARATRGFLEAVEERLGARDDGGDSLRRLLEDAKRRPRRFDSAFEVMFWLRLKLWTLPLPRPQYEVNIGTDRNYFIDFAWPNQKVAVELEGFDAHGYERAFNSDKRRSSALGAAGWLYLPLTFTRYRTGLLRFFAEVHDALHRRGLKAA